MNLGFIILFFIIGLVLIIKGGDLFVDAAAWIAEVSGIPKFLIGATVVSFATTLPELIVSLIAAVQGKVDLSVGNAVGSVTANTSFIMALALIFLPTTIKRQKYIRQSVILLLSASILVICGFIGYVGLAGGIVLLLIFAFNMSGNIKIAKASMTAASLDIGKRKHHKKETFIYITKFILGTAGIVIGAQLLVNNGSEMARLVGIPERIIGVTLIAVGTSLPELVTTITAIKKKQASLSIGNIIGANIINLTMILPVSALVTGQNLPITQGFAFLDLPACLFVCLLALIPALITKRFSRVQGFTLLIVYIIYVLLTAGIIG